MNPSQYTGVSLPFALVVERNVTMRKLRAAYSHVDTHSGYKLLGLTLLTFGPCLVLSIYFLVQYLGSEQFKTQPKYNEKCSQNH